MPSGSISWPLVWNISSSTCDRHELNCSEDERQPNQNLQTPLTQEEFETGLREIPGASVQTHTGGGVVAEIDGTVIQTYPTRSTDGRPGYTITSPSGERTHHGSLTCLLYTSDAADE